ncbi:hypothetical protein I4U23_011848 [Adineta vaga]|nr:hypothetical protein I4U23_011848 [Adineta vaga]
MARQSGSEIDQFIQRTRPTNRDLIRRDIVQATQSNVSTLKLDIAPYYYNNGTSRDSLRLVGTVLCRYRGNQYNIPIEIWLQQDHPFVAPIACVKPTPDMHVSTASADVRPDGTIIIPYMRNWRHPNSDLSNLLNAMSEAFSQSPPVYSASTTATRSTPYPTSATSMPMPQGYSMPTGSNTSYSYPYGYPQQQIPQDIYRESLQAAVLNKVRTRLDETIQIGNAQIDSLRKTEQDLNNGEKKLQTIIHDLEQQQVQAQNYMTSIRAKTNAMIDAGQKTPSSKRESSVEDDALILSAPVYKQLLQAYAEEHAIQDLLYYLADGLRKESIGLDIYLKAQMANKVKNNRQIDILPLVDNDNKVEYSTPPVKSKNVSPNVNTADGLYFKSNDELDAETEDHLTLLYRQGIEQQAKEVMEDAEKKPMCEIFEIVENTELNENVPGVNMSFLDRLFHQLTRKPPSESDYYSDDVFEDINQREITTVCNNYSTDSDETKSNNESSFMNSLRSFFDDLSEETDVIRGVIDDDSLFNRRSRRAHSISSSTRSEQITSF